MFHPLYGSVEVVEENNGEVVVSTSPNSFGYGENVPLTADDCLNHIPKCASLLIEPKDKPEDALQYLQDVLQVMYEGYDSNPCSNMEVIHCLSRIQYIVQNIKKLYEK